MAASKQKPAEQKSNGKRYRTRKIKLIFNPSAGEARTDQPKLEDILSLLNCYQFETDVFIIEPGCDLARAIHQALAKGIKLFVACGSDGTASSTGGLLAGTEQLCFSLWNTRRSFWGCPNLARRAQTQS